MKRWFGDADEHLINMWEAGAPAPPRRAANSLAERAANPFQQAARELLRVAEAREGGRLAVGITSSRMREGVTTVACELARHVAEMLPDGAAIVELNCVRPQLAQRFGMRASPGVFEAMSGAEPVEQCLRPVPGRRFWTMPIGHLAFRSFLDEEELSLASLLAGIQSRVRLAIFDLPPVHANETLSLVSQLDAVVLVVEAARTRRIEVERSLGLLRASATVQGIILNKSPTQLPAWTRRFLEPPRHQA